MRPAVLRVSFLTHLALLSGCSMRVSIKAPIAPDVLQSTKSQAYTIATELPAYLADPVSRYEGPELLAVERDIESITNETDNALLVEEVELLKKDWGILVALDNVMQQESVI